MFSRSYLGNDNDNYKEKKNLFTILKLKVDREHLGK